MKPTLATLLLIPAMAYGDTAAEYINFIRQIQQDTGVEWDLAVESEGRALAPTGVSAQGSFFELWSIHGTKATEYYLDEQFVSSYTPNAQIEIVTADPYELVSRTRVDQPFNVLVTVDGLVQSADAAAPEAAKKVDYSHATFRYEEGTHSLREGRDATGALREEGYMMVNGTAKIRFASSNLTGPDLTAEQGEEIFTVSARADFGASATVLDSKRVQVWPVAQATLSGFDSESNYEEVPSVAISLQDLYPDSTTYLRVYHGNSQAESEGAVLIPQSTVVISDSIPQDRTLTLNDLDPYFITDGVHTIEVLHETPFGIDLLASGSIRIDRTVEIVGSVYSTE